MNLYDMNLGEHFWCSEMDCNILRVPGGWVLRNYNNETGENIISQTFVPFNNEFMEISADSEDQQEQTANIDYTAALHSELMQWNISEDLVIDESLISKLATRLNSVVKAQQNCV